MKLTCSRNHLHTAFSTVSGVVPSRTTREILRNVKLSLSDGKATLIGTDGEVSIRYELTEVTTDSVGEVLLPTQQVSQILREVRDESIDLEVSEEALWIRTAQSEFRLSVVDPAEYPSVANFEDASYYVIAGKDFKTGIQRTLFATDVESTRYALGGVLVELEGERMTLAATDSRRLAVFNTVCRTEGQVEIEKGQPVVPAKAMSLIERSIEDSDQDVHLALHARHVLVRSGPSTISALLVEGRFPKYQDVVPGEFQVEIDLVAGPFLSAVRQAMIVTDQETRAVDFSFDAGQMTLTSMGHDVGSSRINLPVSYEGEPVTVTFEPRFVQEFLRVIDPAQPVKLKLIDGNSAAVFSADDAYPYVVMPLSR